MFSCWPEEGSVVLEAVTSSAPHQKNANSSAGLPVSLQYLTYYHNIVSEMWSACLPLRQLIANHQDSNATNLKCCSFKGSSLRHSYEGQLLLHSNPSRSPPPGCPIPQKLLSQKSAEAYCSLFYS